MKLDYLSNKYYNSFQNMEMRFKLDLSISEIHFQRVFELNSNKGNLFIKLRKLLRLPWQWQLKVEEYSKEDLVLPNQHMIMLLLQPVQLKMNNYPPNMAHQLIKHHILQSKTSPNGKKLSQSRITIGKSWEKTQSLSPCLNCFNYPTQLRDQFC